jgi:hypothetical protein
MAIQCSCCYRELKFAKDTNIWLSGPEFSIDNNPQFLCNKCTHKCTVCGINASHCFEFKTPKVMNYANRCDYHLIACDDNIISCRVMNKLISVEEEQVFFVMTD